MLYLDNSATTKPYKDVLSTFIKVTEEYFANPSSLHKLGSEAEGLLHQSRKQVANLLGVFPNEIIFTSGGTEGNNLAIKGAAFANQHKGRHLITSVIEHPSVLESFKQLEKIHGFEITYLPVDENGSVSCDDLQKNLRNDTILVSIMHVNNEVGTIQPIAEIGQLIKQQNKNTLFHVDHVQGVTKVPLHFGDAHIDLCTISGHKFHGLNGTGVLYVKTGVQLLPLFTGGSQELEMRSGTESLAGNVALAKALRLTTEKAEKQLNSLKETTEKLRSELMEIRGVVVNTPVFAAPHIMNFSVPNLKAEVLIHYFGEHDIYLSTTSACSSRRKTISHTLLEMNKKDEVAKSAIRVSLSLDHNVEIVEPFITTLKNGINKLTKVMR